MIAANVVGSMRKLKSTILAKPFGAGIAWTLSDRGVETITTKANAARMKIRS